MPLEKWQGTIPIFLQIKKSTEKANLNLTCTFEGVRTLNGRTEAFISLTGEVRRQAIRPGMSPGKVKGYALVDVATGCLTLVNQQIRTEFEVEGSDLRVAVTKQTKLERTEGNSLGLIAAVTPPYKTSGPGPGPVRPFPGTPGSPILGALPQPPPPADVVGKTTVDLIPLFDPAQDIVHGRWLGVGNALHCNFQGLVPRIQFPYQPPEEYDYIVTFSQPNLRNGISMIMPNPRGGAFFLILGEGNGNEYGFEYQLGKPGTRLPWPIKPNTIYTITVQVRRDGVKALLDGKLVDSRTNFQELKLDSWRKMRDDRLLALGCDDPTVFHYVRVIEITGSGKKGRPASATPSGPGPAPVAGDGSVFAPKNGMFTITIPKGQRGITQTRVVTISGRKVPVEASMSLLPDGATYHGASVGIPAVVMRELPAEQRFDVLRDAIGRQAGDKITEEKDIKQDFVPGKEYLFQRRNGAARMQLFTVAGWVIFAIVEGKTQEQVTSKKADEFFNSLKLTDKAKDVFRQVNR